ncbi:MAG: hypothetical protein BroJett011_59250 [Chloroflexota bacterium]|nr:MAG: hypothetical protein BroJett011_59250 [Chloroflexota bacterium]
MFKLKSSLPLLLALPFILTILSIHLNSPADVQAKPLAGFTPTPVPPDNGGGGGGGGSNHDDDDTPTDDDKPTDYVIVQIDRCDLQCSAGFAQADQQPRFQLLASAGASDIPTPLFTPLVQPSAAPELLLPVQLVHDGSNFIVAGELSDTKPTRFSLPYPGRWQVWLTGSPRFMTAQVVDVSGLNLADLQAQLADGPVSMGVVEANAPETQWVKCPLACVKEPPPAVETPPYFPETGGQLEKEMNLSTFLLIGLLDIAVIGLTLWAAFHYSTKKHRL